MSHSAHNLGTGWVQATIDKANASRETALFASVPLLVVVSERTLNIVDAVQHVKENKSEQGLVIEVAAGTEVFCCSYRHSARQSSWPSNGVKALLHAFSGALEEIDRYIKDQMGKGRAARFFGGASNAAKIKVFLQRLENIMSKLENLENVTESVTIALRDSLHDIRPLMSPSPPPNTPDEPQVNGFTSVDQGHTASTSILPPSFSSRETSETSHAATGSSYVHANEHLFAAHLQHSSRATSSVPSLGSPNERPSSNSLPFSPTVASVYSVGDSIHQGAESLSNHLSPSNLASQAAVSSPESPRIDFPPAPPPGFPIPYPMPWVLVHPPSLPSPVIVLLAQDPLSRIPPTTINISNIGNSNDTTTIG